MPKLTKKDCRIGAGLDKEQHNALMEIAQKHNASIAMVIRAFIDYYIKNTESMEVDIETNIKKQIKEKALIAQSNKNRGMITDIGRFVSWLADTYGLPWGEYVYKVFGKDGYDVFNDTFENGLINVKKYIQIKKILIKRLENIKPVNKDKLNYVPDEQLDKRYHEIDEYLDQIWRPVDLDDLV